MRVATFHSRMTPLSALDWLDTEAAGRLSKLSVTTVEALVGAIDSDPVALARVIHVPPSQITAVRHRALLSLPENRRRQMERDAEPRHYALGARPPR